MIDLPGIARRIAPHDLPAGVPFYVLRTSEPSLPPEFRTPQVYGLTAYFLDVAAQEWLRSQGRWRGRGVAVLVNDALLRADSLRAADGDERFADELFQERPLAVFCHELAHVLNRPVDRTEHGSKAVAAMHEALASWQRDTATAEPFPWHAHDAGYLRVLCHVAHRAEKLLDGRLSEPWLLGRCYGLSPLFWYSDAIADELATKAGDSFATIREAPLPEPFLELWRDDVSRFLRDHPSSILNIGAKRDENS